MTTFQKPKTKEQFQAQQLKFKRELARRRYKDFVPMVKDNYEMKWFHKLIAEKLQLVYERKIKRLMIFVPPQHGKTELATRCFPAWVLGKNPNEKIAIASYAQNIASAFNRDIKRRMTHKNYEKLFPQTVLGGTRSGYTNNSVQFELVDSEGYGYTIGVEGQLTSKTVDIGIMDDLVKDRADAQSPTIRENIWNWYVDVFETRLHNNSVQVLIMTRWHQDDPAGRLLKRDGIYSEYNKTGWQVVSLPGLRTADVNDYDPRPLGAALWPERHSQERIEKVRRDNPITFNALYQQDPKPSEEAQIFPNWIEIDKWPDDIEGYGLGGDFGFTNDPTAMIKIAVVKNKIYLDEVIFKRGMTNQDILTAYHGLGFHKNIVSVWDNSEPKSVKELQSGTVVEISPGQFIKLEGINARGSDKGPGTIEAGINKLNEYTVYYTSRSLNIKEEKNNYQYEMFNGVSTNKPVPGFDHCMDAIRGFMWTLYGKPRQQFKGPNNNY